MNDTSNTTPTEPFVEPAAEQPAAESAPTFTPEEQARIQANASVFAEALRNIALKRKRAANHSRTSGAFGKSNRKRFWNQAKREEAKASRSDAVKTA